MLRRLVCVVSFALSVSFAIAQQPAPAVPNFDVVSVKPNNSGGGMIRIMFGDDRCEMTNVTLGIMLQNAYGLRPSQVTGLPSWANSDHFDVQCKVVDADKELLKKLTPEQRRPMYQAILKDRFGLQAHLETKNMAVFDLVVGKDGVKMEALAPQTDADKEAERAAPPVLPASVNLNKPGGPGAKMGRGSMMSRRTAEGFHLEATGVKMQALANMLSNQAGRIVVDKTGLSGEYTFQLRWAPEDGPGAAHADTPTEALPSLFTAVQEQLGLRLASSKGDVEMLVVDHVDHPSEN